jgi:general secretion pathway protein C
MDHLENAPKSGLRLRLVGTSVFTIPEYSLCSIVDDSKAGAPAELFSINECVEVVLPPDPLDAKLVPKPRPCQKVAEAVKLIRIEAERVYILNDNEHRIEYLAINDPPDKNGVAPKPIAKLDDAPPPTDDLGKDIKKTSDTNYEVGQNVVDGALQNLAGLATDARIVPAFEGGKSVGFKMFSIRPGSLYAKIGLQNGDVISRINGYEMSSPDKALEVYQKLKDSKHVTVDLKRRGKGTVMDYNITP